MKIVFMGTPDFAIPSLKALTGTPHTVEAVVTAPDKQRGRGQKLSYTPVKEFALEKNIPILQPGHMKDENFITRLREINADVFIIVAFRILPKEVYTLPSGGSFNLHGSLLPKYRGAAPIQWAVINGERKTGVTTFFLQDKVDTGNIILQEEIEIRDNDDFGTLHDRMSEFGASVVLKTIELINTGNLNIKKQDDSQASPAPKITRETCLINWNQPAVNIHNLIRGLSPYPGAFFMHNEKVLKIFKSSINNNLHLKPGEIQSSKSSVVIGCGQDSLNVHEIQPEGSRRMKIDEFLRGHSL